MKKQYKQKYVRHLNIICAFILLLMSLGSLPAVGQSSAPMAATIYVDIDATGANDGTTWEDAFIELQPALEAAVADDQIWVAAGMYLPTEEQCGVGDRYKTFQLKNGVGVYGGFDPSTGDVGWDDRDWVANATTLSGDIGVQGDNSDNSYHVFCHPEGLNLDSSAVLDGFTIRDSNGNSSVMPGDRGGGMFNSFSSPTLINLTIMYNSAVFGGGIFNTDYSSSTLTNVTLSNNTAISTGGGMANFNFSSPTMTNITFLGNIALGGGGMQNDNSSPTLIDVTFSNNSASSYGGGGIGESNSSSTLTNVTFSNNSANNGGGIGMLDSSPILENVTFSGNTAFVGGGISSYGSSAATLVNVTFDNNSAFNGGGMFNDTSMPTLINVTFSGNTASNVGGGICNQFSTAVLTNVTFSGNTAVSGGGILNYHSTATLTNNILWGDTPVEIYNDSSNTVVTYSDLQGGYAGEGNIDADPLLGPLQDNGGYVFTHALGAGSPVIDTGNPDPVTCPATDARGIPRPQDGDEDGTAVCDMGAYELLPERFPTSTSITADLPEPSSPGQQFTVTVEVSSTFGIPTGVFTVTVSESPASCSSELADGLGACSLSIDASGTYTLTAEFGGDDFYIPSSDIEEHVVRLVESTTQITGDAPDPSLPGQPITVTVVVTSTFGIPTGVVTVTVSDSPASCNSDLLDGIGGCSLTLSDPGTYTMSAAYGGDNTHAPSTSSGEVHTVFPYKNFLAIICR